VIQTVANEGKGIDAVADLIDRHRQYQEGADLLRVRRMDRIGERIRELVAERLRVQFWNTGREEYLAKHIGPVYLKESTPYEVAEELVRTFPG